MRWVNFVNFLSFSDTINDHMVGASTTKKASKDYEKSLTMIGKIQEQ